MNRSKTKVAGKEGKGGAVPSLKLADLKKAYDNNQNIMGLFREASGHKTNDQLAILTSYDLQAGSYTSALNDPEFATVHELYTRALAAVLADLQPASILEAGVGEATTLAGVTANLKLDAQTPILGFDLAWSRIHVARRFWEGRSTPRARFFVGELEAIPLPDHSVDVVFTAHALEPNHGRERLILRELKRVAARFVVLFEPGYELAGADAQAYMETHGYCRGLKDCAEAEGLRVREHRLLEVCKNPRNPTAVLVLEVPAGKRSAAAIEYACPGCGQVLVSAEGAYFCAREGLAYPVLRDIPCLARRHGIIASHFLSQ